MIRLPPTSPRTDTLFPSTPLFRSVMTRLSNEQEAIREKARELANAVIAPRAAAVDREEAYPWDNVRALREAGFVGMTIPRDLGGPGLGFLEVALRSEEHTSELQSIMRISYAVFCLKKKNKTN